jgi:hypothetical protein
MVVLWSFSDVRADSFQKNWKLWPSDGKGVQRNISLLLYGQKGRVVLNTSECQTWFEFVYVSLRRFFLYYSLCFLVPERFRDRPEYKSLVLRLTEVEPGW